MVGSFGILIGFPAVLVAVLIGTTVVGFSVVT
jgi:hypothetical protein